MVFLNIAIESLVHENKNVFHEFAQECDDTKKTEDCVNFLKIK